MIQNLTADLNLTADQQTQVRTIFREQAVESRNLAQKLRDQRTAMAAAVKSGATDQIDKISEETAQTQAPRTANRARMLARFYAVLTPDQRTKVEPKVDAMFQGMSRGAGSRN